MWNWNRTRSRRCDSPEPTAGGNDCKGESDENENCNFHTCIGNHCCCCLFVCLFMYPIYSSSAWGMGRKDQLDPCTGPVEEIRLGESERVLTRHQVVEVRIVSERHNKQIFATK